ncbi:MAG: discoidin domain-containing protein [Planctomycetes bacterium]|nr:discoidin domain-containing protein [Planctomycetota bacterium]
MRSLLLQVTVVVLVCSVPTSPTRAAEGAAGTIAQSAAPSGAELEADWLRQLAVRALPPLRGAVTPEDDAAGGCDGVKDGRWGFHTGRDERPWWQVDLGAAQPLGEARIFNRSDGASERASRLEVLLSLDGASWVLAYRHDGTLFRGTPDGKPLVVALSGATARYVRLQLPGPEFLHLDEVEVYGAGGGRNLAFGRPAAQSSVSAWSKRAAPAAGEEESFALPAARRAVADAIERGRRLAASLRGRGAGVEGEIAVDVAAEAEALEGLATKLQSLDAGAPAASVRALYLEVRRAVRRLAFKDPLLDFDDILFVKQVPTSFTHMSDQYYGWFSRPGGGLFVLEGFRGGSPGTQGASPRLRRIAAELPEGSIVDPELSHDGRKVLFAHARFHPSLADEANKLDKSRVPEDAFYHIYEVNADGTGLRRLTRGKYDDFAGRSQPGGALVCLSTRRGKGVQCAPGRAGARRGVPDLFDARPDCYVRCGGGPERPVAVYTLHVMGPDGEDIRTISPFENFEWSPWVAADGRILYARWDYVDRDNMPYMGLWSCLPDGTGVQAVFGNYTVSPFSFFEARDIPGSRKLVFTASAHHSITGGSLVLLDLAKGTDGHAPMERLTPEVPFPEVEAWPASYFANPWPLSEERFLVAWSDRPLVPGWPAVNPPNALGLYLFDAFGNLELLHRDLEISSMSPIPLRPRSRPAEVASGARPARAEAGSEARMLVVDVHDGLEGVERGAVKRLRVVGVPAKTHPTMNFPSLGVTRDDPGKFVLGTVPVEEDGSAYFLVPPGVPIFFQALDSDGMALQTMRSAASARPGETRSCTGCHLGRHQAPPNRQTLASRREPSRIAPGPEGSWPLDFAKLVGPVLARRCESCHRAGAAGSAAVAGAAGAAESAGGAAGGFDLSPEKAYESLVAYGKPSLKDQVLEAYRRGRSLPGTGGARSSALLELLRRGHEDVELEPQELERLVTWMDTYAQKQGSFGPEQEEELRELRGRLARIVEQADSLRR